MSGSLNLAWLETAAASCYGMAFLGCRFGYPRWVLRMAGWRIWIHHWHSRKSILLRLSLLMLASILIGVGLFGPKDGPAVGANLLGALFFLNGLLILAEQLALRLSEQRAQRWWEANLAIQRMPGWYVSTMELPVWPHRIRDNRIATALTAMSLPLGIGAALLPIFLQGATIAYFTLGLWSMFYGEGQRIAARRPQI